MECIATDNASQNMGIQEAMFSFGIISDIQYADIPDGTNFAETKCRYYRDSIKKLDEAITFWNSGEQPAFVLQLGDVIDGRCKDVPNGSETAFKAIRDSFSKLAVDLHCVLGNHELYNFSRKTLLESGFFRTNSSADAVYHEFYHEFTVESRYRFVILDCYEISVLGYNRTGDNYNKGLVMLKNVNRNADWNSGKNLVGLSKRFVGYNGAVSEKQLMWLDSVLTDADRKQQIVVVSGHQPILPASFPVQCVCWNYDAILAILHKHRCVRLYLFGHTHSGGSAIDEAGIHHVALPGIVETPLGETAIGTVHCYTDRIDIHGQGTLKSLSIPADTQQH